MLRIKLATIYIITLFYVFLLPNISFGLSPQIDSALAEIKTIASDGIAFKTDKKNEFVSFISGSLSKFSDLPPGKIAFEFISHYHALFGINKPLHDLEISRIDETPNGHFVHFQQKKNGLDVFGSKITIRIRMGVVRSIANYFKPDIPISGSPEISKKTAINTAKKALHLKKQKPIASLVYFPWEDSVFLAFKVDFSYTDKPNPSRFRVYVNAENGDIILIENRVMNDGPVTGTGYGIDGLLKSFPTYQLNGKYYLGNLPLVTNPNITIKTYTADNGNTLPGAIMKDPDNDNFWTDPAALDAHYYGNQVFSFYKNNFSNFSWFGSSGFNNSGGLISTVHYQTGYDNAFWNGSQMVYGDGSTIFYPLSGSLDVVTHEITHGVTESISNFLYCKEPGALSESWSDVMAMFLAYDHASAYPFLIAEDIMKIAETNPAYYALRSMDDPPFRTDIFPENNYDPADPLNSWGQPEHTSEHYYAGCWPWTDNGGVHINSGIPNKAAYLVAVDPDVGFSKAKQIYYYALFYLSQTSQFIDARYALEQSTIDLFGDGAELNAVRSAFNEVGIQ